MRNPFKGGPRPGLVFGVVIVLLALGAFYWFRTERNQAQLTQRNLRDLARIARAIEAKTDNLEDIVRGLKRDNERKIPHLTRLKLFEAKAEAEGRTNLRTTCESPRIPDAEGTRMWLHANGRSVCVEHLSWQGRDTNAQGRDTIRVAEFDLVGLLHPVMRSSFFDEILLADDQGQVILQPGATGQRLREVPLPSARDSINVLAATRNSAAYGAKLGGRDFIVFLQPIALRVPGLQIDSTATNGQVRVTERPTRWQLGGLVHAWRFRSEGLALDPGKLSILLVLVVFTVLAWPFLKLWSMGERERVATNDLLFLGFSLLLGSGIVAICVLYGALYWSLHETFDDQLGEIGERMATNTHAEMGRALEELDQLSAEFHRKLEGDSSALRAALDSAGVKCPERAETDTTPEAVAQIYDCLEELNDTIFSKLATNQNRPSAESEGSVFYRTLERSCLPLRGEGSGEAEQKPEVSRFTLADPCESWPAESRPDSVSTRFPYFDMAIWLNPRGFQVAKWSPKPTVTPRRSVFEREYFQRVRRGELWRRAALPGNAGAHADGDERGEHQGGGAQDTIKYFLEVIRSINTGEILVALSKPFQPETTESPEGWAAVMITKLASLDLPVLPPGFGFAVIDSDGQVLFHSLPERALEANFIEEADRDRGLRSAVLARAEGYHSLRYLGRDVRLFLTPIGSTPLSLITYHDRAYLRTVAFETLAIALTLFGAFVVLLLVFGVGVQVGLSRRLAWAWPGGGQPHKHRALLLVFAILAAGSAVQALAVGSAPRVEYYVVQLLSGTYLVALFAVAATLFVLAERPAQCLIGLSTGLLAVALLVKGGWHVIEGLFESQTELQARWWLVWVPLFSVILASYLLYRWSKTRDSFAPWLTLPGWLDRNLYPLTVFGGLLVVGTLPAVLSFTIFSAEHLELLVKHTQLRTVEELQRRDIRIRAEYGPPGSKGRIRHAALFHRRDGFDGESVSVSSKVESWRSEPYDVLVGNAFNTCYRPPALYPEHSETAPDPAWRCVPDSTRDSAVLAWARPREGLHDKLLHGFLGDYPPFFTEVSVQTRHLYHEHAMSDEHADSEKFPAPHDYNRGWWWKIRSTPREGSDDSSQAVHDTTSVVGPEDGEPILLSVGAPFGSYAVVSWLPNIGLPPGQPGWIGLLVVLVVLLYLMGFFLLIRLVAREVFLIDLQPTRAFSMKEIARRELAEAMIIVTPWAEDRVWFRQRDDVVTFDLRELRRRTGDKKIELDPPAAKQAIVIEGFEEALHQPGWGERLLTWIEELRAAGRRTVLVVDRDPDELLFRSEAADFSEATPDKRDRSENANDTAVAMPALLPYRERWAHLLSSFTKVFAGRPSSNAGECTVRRSAESPHPYLPWTWRLHPSTRTRNEQLLRSECAITTALQPVEGLVRGHPNFGRLSDDALTHLVCDAAAGQYRRIWNGLNEQERMTLAQIADGAVSLPKRHRTLARMLSRGLLERRPDLRLMNRSFAHFVRETVPSRQLAAWASVGNGSAWRALRQPLMITLVAVALFLFFTQRNLFDTGVTFVAAIAAGLPVIFRILGVIRTNEAHQ